MSTRGFIVAGMVAAAFVVLEPNESRAQDIPSVSEESDCPLPLRGSSVTSTPIKRGVELVFTSATSAQVAGLRAHLREVATVVEQQTKLARASNEPDADSIPLLDINVKNSAFGARVIIKTQKPLDVMALQDLGQGLQDAWPESSCGLGPSMQMPTSGREPSDPPLSASR